VRHLSPFTVLIFTILIFAGCRPTHELIETGELEHADIGIEELSEMVPDYLESLYTLSGSGRALISQPGNSDRLTLDFHSDRETSLLTFRNRLGIEGGQLLVQNDSVLVYNRIDKVAEKISLKDANLTDVGTLATINLIELFHFPFHEHNITDLFQDNQFYVAITGDDTRITIDRDNGLILDLQTHPDAGYPYSRIHYEAYGSYGDFTLPGKITIFSSDGEIRVTFLVRQLQTNSELPDMEIPIPEEVPIIVL
jgi:hypothetical protein